MNNQQGTGRDITFVNGAVTTVRSGGPVIIGAMCAVVKSVERNNVPLLPGQASAAGDRVCASLEGVFDLGKTAALAIAIGEACYVNTSTLLVTKTNTDVFVGFAAAAAAGGASTVSVILRQSV